MIRTHLRWGWWSLLAFLTMGIVLEILHGLKVGWYLDVPNETRRLMWTLAHAHGTLVSLIHIGFSASLGAGLSMNAARLRTASWSLIGAGILLPGGFFLGGVGIYGGDPGLGILLVPVGALMLLVAVLVTALASADERR
ncbi:MAG: hypothetical protein ACYTHJ_19220 [Planctomycetota bacterium]|jgi:hypothetical protein